ncbi:MAG: Pr6Pr family membrane protein [Pseudonocardiales bacterium]|nr:Pr6Pr family membrane protein [Actinomycetota bacterium]
MLARTWHATIAVIAFAALALQLWIAVRVSGTPSGTEVGRLSGATLAGRILRTVSFFTIQSNVLAAITSAQLARRPDRDGQLWRVIRLDALVGIAVTGVVYSAVLAATHDPQGWQQVSTNTATHYIVPIMMVLGWLLFGPRRRITGRVVAGSLVFPIVWFGYTLIRGAITPWYPYPFTDVVAHGYVAVSVNALLVTVLLGAVSALFWWGDRQLRPAPRAPAG